MSQSEERRRSARVELDTEFAFRRPRESYYAVTAHDLTAHGCKVACPERLDVGELVWVQLPSLESLPSWVRWTHKAQSGIEFDRPMHAAVFGMMAGRLAPVMD